MRIDDNPPLSLIVAISEKSRGIGFQGSLLRRIPNDMQHFKEITTGHPVIMGRKTWDSLPERFRPLANRTNIITTRDSAYNAPGAVVVTSLPDAFSAASKSEGAEEIFVIGGGAIYAEALPYVDRLYLTIIQAEAEADTFFPEYESEFKTIVSKEDREYNNLKYSFVVRER